MPLPILLNFAAVLLSRVSKDFQPHIDCKMHPSFNSGFAHIVPDVKRISLLFLARGVAFESESDLREKGAYKTPDMLLQVPMAVKGPSNEVGCCIRVGDSCARGPLTGRPLSVGSTAANCVEFMGSCF